MNDEFNNNPDDFSEKTPETPPPNIEDPAHSPPNYDDSPVDMNVSDDDRLWALLAYVLTPLIPIVIMLMEDKNKRPFIRAHNGQALVWGLINMIFGTVLSTFMCGLPSLVIWLVGCYWGWQAYQGQLVTIPVITDFVKSQGWA